MKTKSKALLSWSSGKDSAWTLHVLRQQRKVEVVGLVTTVNEVYQRVAMHAVRENLLEAQAASAGLPLWKVTIPNPCSNEEYEAAMARVVDRARNEGIEHFAFGDLFLADIRKYREERLSGTGVTPLFPIWGLDTTELPRQMIEGGLRARITCIDPRHLPHNFAGREFDADFLQDLPSDVDPCGERGEFHTFAYDGPMFQHSIPLRSGEITERGGFVFADLLTEEKR